MTSNQYKHAAGIFSSREITEQAMKELKESGFAMSRSSVLVKDSDQAEQMSTTELKEKTLNRSERMTIGATEGAATGGLLMLAGGVAALLIPGIGLALAAESVLTVLLSSSAVAVSGGLLGALRGWFMSDSEAAHYYDRVDQGGYFVAIEGTDAELRQAEQILRKWGIQDWSVFAPSNH